MKRPYIDDYPQTDNRTYYNLDGTVNWKKYAEALDEYILSLSPVDKGEEQKCPVCGNTLDHKYNYVTNTLTCKCGKRWLKHGDKPHPLSFSDKEETSSPAQDLMNALDNLDKYLDSKQKKGEAATAEEFYLNYYSIEKLPRHRVICDASEIIELMNQYSALRKVEMPSEENVEEYLLDCADYVGSRGIDEGIQAGFRACYKWMCEQIKHLNKLT